MTNDSKEEDNTTPPIVNNGWVEVDSQVLDVKI
jgi:hypothetical protein